MEPLFRPITVAPSIRNMENSRRPYGELQQAHASCVVHGSGYLLRRGPWDSKAASGRASDLASSSLGPFSPTEGSPSPVVYLDQRA